MEDHNRFVREVLRTPEERWPDPLPRPLDNSERMTVAKAWAHWHIGDASWATQLLDAYFTPRPYARLLKQDIGEETP